MISFRCSPVRAGVALAAAVAVASPGPARAQETAVRSPVLEAVERLHAAPSREARSRAAEALDALEVPFETLYATLARGRAYGPDVPRGRIDGSRRNADGTEHPYILLVPETYDPERRYPVRIWLHGGIGRPAFTSPGAWWRDADRLASENRITLIPASWNASRWWHESQLENLDGLLGLVKRTYNVDENRVALLGISDGGSGVYYHASRNPTPYAAFLPFIGHVAVVNNPRVGAEGEVYARNLLNRPLYIVNTENDRLYPYRTVAPYVEQWRAAGGRVTFRPIDGAGHDMSWMRNERPSIDTFLLEAVRDPLPDEVWLQTERSDRRARIDWVRIDSLGAAEGETEFPRIRGLGHEVSSGTVHARRDGQRIVVDTHGVLALRLLLSPAEVDFGRPVSVEINGTTVFSGRPTPDRQALLRYHAEDDDRTALYGAELTFRLEPARSR